MGYAILMQWTPAAPGRTSTSDLILSRVLEHYNITHPLRSSIQFRTFRASFPAPPPDATAPPPERPPPPQTRILTTITYSQPIPPMRDVSVPTGARDDCTYLFLEDRGVPPAPVQPAGNAEPEAAKDAAEKKEDKKDEKRDDKNEGKKDQDNAKDKEDDKTALEEDGFEIIEPPKDGPAASDATATATATAPVAQGVSQTEAPAAAVGPTAPRPREKYRIMAVKPATLVMPTLHNLLSPFVLGLSKQARAGASQTGQAAAPTPLSGSPLVLTTLAFPPPAHPQPPLTLSVHILPNTASTIFLEAEWEGAGPDGASRAVLEEFLRGCVPDGVTGDAKILAWQGEENGLEGWAGVEKTRRITSLLARALRESNYI